MLADSQNSLGKDDKVRGLTFQYIWKKIESPKIGPWIYDQLILTKILLSIVAQWPLPRSLNGEKIVSSKNSTGTMDYPHIKVWHWSLNSHHI